MNIWVMNLKDDRENFEKPNDLSKFQFCLNNGIIGIGWGNEIDLPDAQKSKNHLDALNSLKAIKIGDLIWINGGDEYYIATAKSEIKQANPDWHKYDIANYIECDFYKIGAEIPEKLKEHKDKLVAHSTIQHKPENEEFYRDFNLAYEIAKNNSTKNTKKTLTKESKLAIIITAFLLLLFIALMCISNVEEKSKKEKEEQIQKEKVSEQITKEQEERQIETDNESTSADIEAENEQQFPTIEQYISALKSIDGINPDSIGDGTIKDGAYIFNVGGTEYHLLLNDNKEVVNLMFMMNGKLSNYANDMATISLLASAYMKPLYDFHEKKDLNIVETSKTLYSSINSEVKRNNLEPNFTITQGFEDCHCTITTLLYNSSDPNSKGIISVVAGYKKD